MTTDLLSLFQALLEFTLVFTAQLLVILLVRKPVCRWFGAVNAYRLWLLPVLWLPFYLLDGSAVSLDRLLVLLPAGTLTPHVQGSLITSGFGFLNLNLSLPGLPAFSLAQSARPGVWLAVCALWFSGMLVLLVREGRNMVRFARYVTLHGDVVQAPEAGLVTMFSKTVPVCHVKGLESPALYGLFRPMLLLPEYFLNQYDADQRHVILSHETIHLQRKDNFWNVLAYGLRVVFWFNPVVYVAHRYYRLDQELSCDARALEQCNTRQSRRYAGTLVEAIEKAKTVNHPPIIAAWENPQELKERILMINQHLTLKSHRALATLCLLTLVVAGGGLTSCASNSAVPKVMAAEESGQRPLPARNDNVISRRIYESINEVVELRDAGNYGQALAILDDIKALDDEGRLNSREQFVLWQFMANLDQVLEKYEDADTAYERILALPTLNADQREQALLMRGSLQFVMENYNNAINYFEEYNRVASEPNANVYYRLGAAHYQLEQYAEAIPLIEKQIGLLEDSGKDIPRSSYALLRALYINTGDDVAADAVLEKMVGLYDDPDDKALLADVARNQRAAAAGGGLGEVVVDIDNVAIKSSETEMLPMVTSQPDYPTEAVDQHIEGWALVGFTVTKTGAVSNPTIIDAEPEGVFDDVSLAAVSGFKFKPRIEDGQAVEATGVRYLFRYNLSPD